MVFLIILLSMLRLTKCSIADLEPNSCTYYFLQQPQSNSTCNPWPVIRSRGSVLELPCHIKGPHMSEDLTNVVWYRYKFLEGAVERVEIDNDKYFNPISSDSEDIGDGFNRVNFTLNIANVNEEDLGCYWCQIDISAFNCSFSFFNSSHFCLLRFYPPGRFCATIPINDTMVCVSDMSCDPPPTDVSVMTTFIPSQSLSTIAEPSLVTDSSPQVTDSTLPDITSTMEPHTLLSDTLPTSDKPVPTPHNIFPEKTTSTENVNTNQILPIVIPATFVAIFAICITVLIIIIAIMGITRRKLNRHNGPEDISGNVEHDHTQEEGDVEYDYPQLPIENSEIELKENTAYDIARLRDIETKENIAYGELDRHM